MRPLTLSNISAFTISLGKPIFRDENDRNFLFHFFVFLEPGSKKRIAVGIGRSIGDLYDDIILLPRPECLVKTLLLFGFFFSPWNKERIV